jgi:hypothetical protein
MTVQAWIPGEYLPYPVDEMTLLLAEPDMPPEPDAPAPESAPWAEAEAQFRLALADAIAEARAARWRQAQREAIAAHARWIARHGLPLAAPAAA